MRGLHKVLTIADREIVVRELTVAELRQWIAAAGGESFDVVNEKLRTAPLSLLATMCGMTIAELEEAAPFPDTDLAEVEVAARECNPSFFGLLGLAQKAGPG
jgi:hypothetical protein